VSDTVERLQAALADRYAIERELGAGGMATVYLAADLKHGRQVAIKVLHPELAASIGTERFDREIRLAARLQHPHILGLYDSGAADGLLYYVMPFVVGESLRDRLNRDQMLPIEEAVQIALETADALGHAHMMGVVHRDIKPENILLSGGHALVADFGIARAASAAGGEKLTQTGVAIGTPLYMSPEQAAGDVVGPTADLYSLGCVLYEMLCGSPPFTGLNARAIMARHAMTPVPSLQEVRDTIPDEVEDAVMACLNKMPADRPQTAAQFCEMLGTPLGGTATRRTGMRITSTRHTAARTASHRAAATRELAAFRPVPFWRRPAAVAAAVLLLAGGFAFWMMRRGSATPSAAGGPKASDLAVLYFDDLSPGHELGYLADGLSDGLITSLSRVRNLNVISAGGSAQFRGKGVSRDSIARALGVGTLVLGSVEPDGDRVRVTVRLADASGAEFNRVTFEEPTTNLLLLSDSLAPKAAALIRSRLGSEIRLREERSSARNPDAWAAEQRASQARRLGDSLYAAGSNSGFEHAYATADSLAAIAEQLDPAWIDPMLLRGTMAYWRARRAADDAGLAGRMVDSGLIHAEQALALDKDDADALELRGNLKYWRWLFPLETDSVKAKQLLHEAQADLERATQVNPGQAGAYATLSHLYNQLSDKSAVDVSLAARQALEADAYLSNADVILSRLFFAAYDLGQYPDADNWCRQGHQRFPGNPSFVECQLWLLTMKQREADPALATRLADSLLRMTPAADTAFAGPQSRVIVATVLARAGQRDSAQRMLRRNRDNAQFDPQFDLSYISTFAWLLAGDTTEAFNNFKAYLVANPARRHTFVEDPGWWLRGVQSDPRFQQIVGRAR
jgi:serine/threonine-protein kinase